MGAIFPFIAMPCSVRSESVEIIRPSRSQHCIRFNQNLKTTREAAHIGFNRFSRASQTSWRRMQSISASPPCTPFLRASGVRTYLKPLWHMLSIFLLRYFSGRSYPAVAEDGHPPAIWLPHSKFPAGKSSICVSIHRRKGSFQRMPRQQG